MRFRLTVVVYHYVRNLPRTRFPRVNGLLTTKFEDQVDRLADRFEMATLESALEFVSGRYQPTRDLCLLTFDDGLKDHYTEVLPYLSSRGIQGVFFVTTSCLDGRVAAVHKNHFLMADLGFEAYRDAFLQYLDGRASVAMLNVDRAKAECTYRWDRPDMAAFKYLLNFQLPPALLEEALDGLFETYLRDDTAFARELYLNWNEAREMQSAGMVIGGHSHRHPTLARLEPDAQRSDLATCADELRRCLARQEVWPFSYPYGDFNLATIDILRELGFDCSFGLEVGTNSVGHDLFRLRRLDTNDVAVEWNQPLCQ